MNDRIKLIISLFFFINTTTSAVPYLSDKIIAIVNDDIILQSDIDNMSNILKININNIKLQVFNKNIIPYNQILEQLIINKIIMQIATKMQIKIFDQAIDSVLSNIAVQNGLTIKQLQKQLLINNINFQSYRDFIYQEMMIEEVYNNEVSQRIVVLPQEVDLLVNQLNLQFNQNTNVNLNHILIPLLKNSTTAQNQLAINIANKIVKKLKNGANFDKIAINYDINHKNFRNKLKGWKKIEELPTIVAQEIMHAKKGDIIGPIRSNIGFHILKLNDIQNCIIPILVTEVKASHILIKLSPIVNDKQAQIKIQQIADDIKVGKITFNQAAKKYSEDSSSASCGGRLGWNIPDVYDPILRNTLMKLNKGEISQPINSSFGWHLIQLDDKRLVDKSKTIQKDQAYRLLFNRKFNEEIDIWIQEIRSSAYVKIINNDGDV